MSGRSALVIGAGASGLAAASTLRRRGVDVVAVDKGFRPGGRLATRSFSPELPVAVYDYGAQFFTVRSERFASLVTAWREEGRVREWCRGFGSEAGHSRYVGVSGINDVAAALGDGMPVRSGWQAEHIRRVRDGWDVVSDRGDILHAAMVILTAPAPQALTLLDQSGMGLDSETADRLHRITFDPCLAAMVALDRPSRLPDPGGLPLEGGPIRWLADNQRKGISPEHCSVTIHGSADFSRTWMDRDPDEGGRRLVDAAKPWLGADVQALRIHGWRYSMPSQTDPDRALVLSSDPPLICCGDAFQGPRVEGAVLSGWTAAERLPGVNAGSD